MRRVRLPSLALVAACAVPACSVTPGPDAAAEALPGSGIPTLEQIFLIPGVHGEPPASRELSADGSWLLFDWRELELEGDQRRLAAESGPRLISTRDPAASGYRGVPLGELLPGASASGGGPPAEEGSSGRRPGLVHAFFPTGADLALASRSQLFLLRPGSDGDPRGWTVELALDLGNGEAPPEAPGEEPWLRSIQALEFDPRGERLFVSGDGARLAFALSAPRPWSLSDGLATTRAFPTGATPLWSDEREVAFSAGRPLAYLDPQSGEVVEGPAGPEDEDEADPGAELDEDAHGRPPTDPQEPEPPETPASELSPTSGADAPLEARVWLRAEERFVVLADWGEEGRASLSPRGRYVLRTETDESGAPEPTLVPDYLTERVTTRSARRQLADDVALPQHTWIWDTATGARVELVFPDGEGHWYTSVGWAPGCDSGREPQAPERHAWMRVSADFRVMQLWVWSPGGLRQVFEERDPRWHGGPADHARWSADGRALVLGSESTPLSLTPGRSQLFAVDVETRAVRQLTEVAGEVSSFEVLADGALVFTASEDDPARRVIGWVPAAAVTGAASGARTWARALPVPPGWNDSPRVSADGSSVVFAHQTRGQPAELWAVALAEGSEPRRLTRTVPAEYEALPWIRPRPFETAHADGTRVRAHVYLPTASDLERPDRPRATIVFIHGAGYLQNVTDSMTEYAVNLLFHGRLARLGYVVVDVDYRGSAGYGNAFRTDVHKRLGELELADIHLVLDALAARGVIDPRRVACYGGSYGGFLTLMALFTAPERWVAGAALRSVTDWRTYHPRYTQPRLGRPSTQPEAYERCSPIDHAAGLEDPLLILHGLVDSNVFAQDSIRLIEELIDLGKDFEAMLYPSQGHAFDDGRHWLDEYRRIERFLREHLGPP